jgi:heavy metal sensor kinase
LTVFKSIRFSLTLWYSLTLTAILVLFSVFLYLTIRAQFYAETDHDLLQVADSLVSPTFEPFRANPSSALDQVLEDFLGPRYAGKMVQLARADGSIQFQSRSLQGKSLPVGGLTKRAAQRGVPRYRTLGTLETTPVRYVTVPVLVDGTLFGIVQVGQQLDAASEILRELLLIFAISIPLALAAVGYGGWFLAGRALKPMDDIARSAEKIDDKNLDSRLNVTNPDDEIGRLTGAFNRTLDRLQMAFTRTKRFSVDVSHELRTPLTILKGETEVGLKWAKSPEDFREILNNNLEEINRMAGIIEFLQEISRIEEGGHCLLLEVVDLADVLAEVESALRPQAESRDLQISMDQSSPDTMIAGDRQRLRQLFYQLVHNAIQFTPAGGTITLSVAEEGAQVVAQVTDTGAGIPKEDIPCIFDRFYRVDKARNRSHGGSGLGLALVRTLVEAHGGSISVDSALGLGSTFRVTFPHTTQQDLPV